MSDFKQREREWKAARKAEQRARDEQRKAEQEARYQQNLILKQHGYAWRKVQDVFGPSDDGDTAGYVWQLYAPDGTPVTVKEAMTAINGQSEAQ